MVSFPFFGIFISVLYYIQVVIFASLSLIGNPLFCTLVNMSLAYGTPSCLIATPLSL